MRETTLPALERGFAKAGKRREDFEIAYPAFIVTGETAEAMAKATADTRRQIAFYGSTPAYKPVLESIGAGNLQPELNAMSKQGRWVEMGELITDDILAKFAIIGEPDTIVGQYKKRFGNVVDRTMAAYGGIPETKRREMIAQFKAA